jgi:hypothetical protein
MSGPIDHLYWLLSDILDNAQTIRIIQVQSQIEKMHKDTADAAWQHLNSAHKAAIEQLEELKSNASGSSAPDCSPSPEVNACIYCASYLKGICWLRGVKVPGPTIGRKCFKAKEVE